MKKNKLDCPGKYCALPCITATADDPEGFSMLAAVTFVLSFSPNVPGRQIVLSLTREIVSPAGMLCDNMRNDGLEFDEKGNALRGSSMVSLYTADSLSLEVSVCISRRTCERV